MKAEVQERDARVYVEDLEVGDNIVLFSLEGGYSLHKVLGFKKGSDGSVMLFLSNLRMEFKRRWFHLDTEVTYTDGERRFEAGTVLTVKVQTRVSVQ